jgi:hypothetical protein
MTTPDIAEYAETAARHAAIALLWQATDASEDGGNGFPIGDDDNGTVTGDGTEYIDAVIPLVTEAVTAFVTANYELLTSAGVTAEQAGHDLILTANHHGAGFWDRGLGAAGDALTEATRGYSFDAEFALWGDAADGDEHCADELAYLVVENEVLLDDLNWSSDPAADSSGSEKNEDA